MVDQDAVRKDVEFLHDWLDRLNKRLRRRPPAPERLPTATATEQAAYDDGWRRGIAAYRRMLNG